LIDYFITEGRSDPAGGLICRPAGDHPQPKEAAMSKKKPRTAKVRDISIFHLRTRKAGPQTRKKREVKQFTLRDEMSKYE